MWAVTAGTIAYSARKVRQEIDEQKVPLMGVLGAFVFAAQMINFSIPATGSSGHLGGGMLLAVLLGPYAGFLAMAAVLVIQALFFADGGLLALGCNIFNLGFYPCFVAYPLVYKQILKKGYSRSRILAGSVLSAVIGLQLGAFSVVLETISSGITELPFGTFVLLMQPVHLAIGVVEGFITAAIVIFVWKSRPEILETAMQGDKIGNISTKKVMAGLLLAAFLAGGVLSWFASSYPDGLEWSISRITGQEALNSRGGVYQMLAAVQEKAALFPDYGFKGGEEETANSGEENQKKYPAIDAGTSAAGIVGSFLTLVLASLLGIIINTVKRRHRLNST